MDITDDIAPRLLKRLHEIASTEGIPVQDVFNRTLERGLADLENEHSLRVLRDAQARLAELPILDPRPADEILGYDENGLPS